MTLRGSSVAVAAALGVFVAAPVWTTRNLGTIDAAGDVVGYGLTTGRGFLWRAGRVTLLPQGVTPVAVAGGWIVASNGLTDRAILLRLRR